MATMRNMMIVILVFQIIQCAISQPLATNTANSLIPEPTHESTIYECLFIDRNLPICDPKLLADSEEDLSDKNISETMQRSKRNTDISSKDVIVYTVEGCLPPRLAVNHQVGDDPCIQARAPSQPTYFTLHFQSDHQDENVVIDMIETVDSKDYTLKGLYTAQIDLIERMISSLKNLFTCAAIRGNERSEIQVIAIKQSPEETLLRHQKSKQSPKKLQLHSRESALRTQRVGGAISRQPNWPKPKIRLANWESYGQGPRFSRRPSEQEKLETRSSPSEPSQVNQVSSK
ncbi:hypothetical protein K0M31_006982 [Melipona bicolor]|uniref:Uncharacterized protein n=1 Tax=Melipona bicolor TaxID=60889 RepID=A0AA40FS15_9HYME|nr:hypothetical protein K0M31_006982 [Melipona bicolor]